MSHQTSRKLESAPAHPASIHDQDIESLTGEEVAPEVSTTDTDKTGHGERRRASAPPIDGVEHRKNVVDRRTGLERRVLDMGTPTGLERRRGPGRRRSDSVFFRSMQHRRKPE